MQALTSHAMVTVAQYLLVVRAQLHLVGAAIHQTQIGPVMATVAQFNEAVFMSRFRYHVTIAAVAEATRASVDDFRGRSLSLSHCLKVPRRGWDTSVVTIAALVAERADAQARAVAARKPSVSLGSSARSVLVDLAAGVTFTTQATPVWGAAQDPTIRKTCHYLFPSPAAVATLPAQQEAGGAER